MKKCNLCGMESEVVLVTLTDGTSQHCMCPNCIAASVANGTIAFSRNYNLIDDITGVPGAVQFVSMAEQYTLAPRTMLRLLAHDLRPNEWKALCKKYDEHNYMLHDDFYSPDGEALQPVVHIPVYEWRDVVEINGVHYAECFEISGEMDDDTHYQIDDFLNAVARKHNVDVDDIATYMMDDIYFDAYEMPFGADGCGCFIDGEPAELADERFRKEHRVKVSELIKMLQANCKTGDEVVAFHSYEWDDDGENLCYQERDFEEVRRKGNVIRIYITR